MMKTLDLSPNGFGVPTYDMIKNDVLRTFMSKCGQHISRIIYKDHLFHSTINNKLLDYISTYCLNVTSLNLIGLEILPYEIRILAHNCKKIKKLSLQLYPKYEYERELTMLFEENKNLDDITLYQASLCRSLLKLPEHKMKAIKLVCNQLPDNIFSSVSEI